MAHRHGIQLIEILLVKIILVTGALLLRGVVARATGDTLGRAELALAGASIEHDGMSMGMRIGGLPPRSEFLLRPR